MVDLPGTYSLTPVSPDEQVVLDSLHGDLEGVEPPDALLIVADATTLQRSLLLVADVLALGRPTALVLTMIDEVTVRGGSLDLERLSLALGIPVLGIVGHRGVGLDAVRSSLEAPESWPRPVLTPPESGVERGGMGRFGAGLVGVAAGGRPPHAAHRCGAPAPGARHRRVRARDAGGVPGGLHSGRAGHGRAGVVVRLARRTRERQHRRPLGSFLADGIIGGVGGVLVFLPQITLLFLLLALLEKVGYLARAAFLADRVMGRFGLEGRSFVAMLSAFACAIPGIMSTRTIPSERRRLATMMAAPLMTCSARLPVYTLLIAAFIPDEPLLGPLGAQGLTMFGLYLLGAVSGLVYAAILNATALRTPSVPVLMELPPYRMPTMRSVLLYVWDGAWAFVRKAGTIILATTAVLWVLVERARGDAAGGHERCRGRQLPDGAQRGGTDRHRDGARLRTARDSTGRSTSRSSAASRRARSS